MLRTKKRVKEVECISVVSAAVGCARGVCESVRARAHVPSGVDYRSTTQLRNLAKPILHSNYKFPIDIIHLTKVT